MLVNNIDRDGNEIINWMIKKIVPPLRRVLS